MRFFSLILTILLTAASTAFAQANFVDPDGCDMALSEAKVVQEVDDIAYRSSLLKFAAQKDERNRSIFYDRAITAMYQGIPIADNLGFRAKETKLREQIDFMKSDFSFDRHYRYFLREFSQGQLDAWLRCKTRNPRQFAVTVAGATRETVTVAVLWAPLSTAQQKSQLNFNEQIISIKGLASDDERKRLNQDLSPSHEWRTFILQRSPAVEFQMDIREAAGEVVRPIRVAPIPAVPRWPCTRESAEGHCLRYVKWIDMVLSDASTGTVSFQEFDLRHAEFISIEMQGAMAFQRNPHGADGTLGFNMGVTNVQGGRQLFPPSTNTIRSNPKSNEVAGTQRFQMTFKATDRQVAWLKPDASLPPSLLLDDVSCQQENIRTCTLQGFVAVDIIPRK